MTAWNLNSMSTYTQRYAHYIAISHTHSLYMYVFTYIYLDLFKTYIHTYICIYILYIVPVAAAIQKGEG
jgi:hypothetical protein